MAIILEGADNSGKTTLSAAFGLPVIHPGGPPRDKVQEQAFFQGQQQICGKPLVHDRVTCISQQVYQKRIHDPYYMAQVKRMIRTPHCIVIFCRPPDDVLLDFSKHVAQAHDEESQMQYVRDNAELFVRSYDILMSKIPHILYNYKECSSEELVNQVISTQYHIAEWNSCQTKLRAMLNPT